MGTHSTAADVAAIKAILTGYIAQISYTSDSTAEALYQQQATNELNLYCDALLSMQAINAASKSSYATGLGFSATQRASQEAQQAIDAHWSAFVTACARGGVSVPTIEEPSIGYWSLGS